ncbi:antitoxin [Cronbergia sp. UHCC 0137]|uniref:antitoxin n=1 Tax=Cronbergia sp. UHCC 0137 TaxID=3110239 RepID=UPI002B215DA3|nr:antitoxin [Cronbergia sp. UHCC 0137]MEA5620111.1 antitoxin [Cronbergia sp. UHCC 0137]
MHNLDFDNMTIDQLTVALKLDQEERELLESIENDEWVSVPNVEEEIKRFQSYAKNQLARQKIEVKISMEDTTRIYDLANQFGQSVSSLAEDIIHRYLKGELVEK